MKPYKWMVLGGSILIGLAIYLILNLGIHKEQQVFYLVPKSIQEDFEFWLNVKAGAEIAADELGIQLFYDGPYLETDYVGQIAVLEDLLKKEPKPSSIILAPADQEALIPVCEKIMEAGITLVLVDSDVEIKEGKSLIATDNLAGAKKIGEELAKLIKYRGRVAVFSHVKGSSTAIQREEGFRKIMKNYGDIEVIEATYFSDGEEAKAYDLAKELLLKEPTINAIYATNEKTAMGVGKAIKDLSLKGRVRLVGFDAEATQVGFIEEGIMHASMVQRPFNMGYLGVKEAYEISVNKKKPSYIDTGSVLINKDNLFTPANQKLLFPFVR